MRREASASRREGGEERSQVGKGIGKAAGISKPRRGGDSSRRNAKRGKISAQRVKESSLEYERKLESRLGSNAGIQK